MVISYLERLQNEYLDQKLEFEKSIAALEVSFKEKIEFAKMLEESSNSMYEEFSPREGNSKNKIKIDELKEQEQDIQQQISEEKIKYGKCLEKLDEIASIIKVAKTSFISKEEKDETMDSEIYRLTLLETQENERQRISRELHDSTVQNLTSLVHKTELCGKMIEVDPIRCKLELTMMSRTLREIINDTRQMIYNLRPMSFDDIGLHITIERALDKLQYAEVKNIGFTVLGEPYKIKPVIGITLLRIIQEACNNAIKYAEASLISVKLEYKDNEVVITIEDDGKGFDVDNLNIESRKDNSGFGLSMMKERVYLLSGNIQITSKVGKGTKIKVSVPIANKEEE